MRICFWHSDKPRERLLAGAFAEGAAKAGDQAVLRRLTPEIEVADDCEVAAMVGVKSRERWQAHWRAGLHVVMLDKGYCRGRSGPAHGWDYWRIAVDAHHPTRTLMDVTRPHDRLQRLDLQIKPWRAAGEHVLIAGSSAKYHAFYGLAEPTEYAQTLAKRINKLTGRPIVYRPKPSWRDAVPIDGTRFSGHDRSIVDELAGAHAMVTHGSNAAFEALIHGVPAIVLGEAVTKPISSTVLEDVVEPRLATDTERRQLLANLAYCQWTLKEIAGGEAWRKTRPLIYA